MKSALFSAFASLATAFAADAHAAGSLLRVACEGDAARAEVTINGVFKGECPLDVQVNAGTVQLRALKRLDASRERVFQDEFRIGDGVVKKIEVALSAPRLNAEAQRRENERLAMERAEAARREEARQLALAEERRVDQELLQQQQKAAEAGDAAAMVALADRYATGRGVAKSDPQAQAWIQKAAAAGNPVAAFKLSGTYKNGKKEDIAEVLRMLAFPAEQERNLAIKGEDRIRAFVASDPFFDVPGGNRKIAYRNEVEYAPNAKMLSDLTCVRNGRYFQTEDKNESPHVSSTGEGTAMLGALIWLASKSSSGLFKTTRYEITSIDRLSGQPFPLTPGRRFGIAYTSRYSGTYEGVSSTALTCAAMGDAAGIPGRDASQGPRVICLEHVSGISIVHKMYWHEPSGCFVRTSGK